MDKHITAIIVLNVIITLVLVLFFFVRPKSINPIIGYRTKRSMKNESNWNFAQIYFTRNWILLLPIIYFTQILLKIGQVPYSFFGYIILLEFLTGTFAIIFSTERKLKERDKIGSIKGK
jgi:uncharacterized membrane protein